jgi:hypothetical protein
MAVRTAITQIVRREGCSTRFTLARSENGVKVRVPSPEPRAGGGCTRDGFLAGRQYQHLLDSNLARRHLASLLPEVVSRDVPSCEEPPPYTSGKTAAEYPRGRENATDIRDNGQLRLEPLSNY